MGRRHVALLSVAVGQVTLYALAFIAKRYLDAPSPREYDEFMEPVLVAVVLGQFNVFVAWALLGGGARWVNFGILLPLFAADVALGQKGGRYVTAVALVMAATVVASIAWWIRIRRGLKLAWEGGECSRRAALRYGIRHIIALTLIVGIAIPIMQRIPWRDRVGDAFDWLMLFFVISAPAALLVVGMAWAALALRRQWAGFLLASITAAVAVAALWRTSVVMLSFALYLGFLAGLTYATFFVLRLGGYRLRRVDELSLAIIEESVSDGATR